MPSTRAQIAIFWPLVRDAMRLKSGSIVLGIGDGLDLHFHDIDAALAFLRDANQALARPVMNQQTPERVPQDHDQAGDSAHSADDRLGAVEVAQ